MSEKKKRESKSTKAKDKRQSKSKEPEKGKKESKSKKEPEPVPTTPSLLCIHHGSPFTHFCESCDEPICSQCSSLGPHNNQLHRINTLPASYEPRKNKLSIQINQCLLEKKNKLLAQMQRIEYRLEEIHYIKELIEKDVRIEYSGILQRLESAEGAKVALLQHDMQQIQQELNKINDLANTFNKEIDNHLTFLLQSKQIEDQISYLTTKPFKQQIDVYPYDLPRELTQRREHTNQLQKAETMLEAVIWELLRNEKEKEKELDEWSKLNEKYKQEIVKLRLVCFYCGDTLNEGNVNQECQRNNSSSKNEANLGFTDNVPDQTHFQTGKHFFARAKEEQNLNYQEQQQQQQYQQKQISVDQILFKIQRILYERQLDLFTILQRHDKQKNGTISSIQFKYILLEVLNLEPIEAKSIKQTFTNQQNSISYLEFIKCLQQQNQQQDTLFQGTSLLYSQQKNPQLQQFPTALQSY